MELHRQGRSRLLAKRGFDPVLGARPLRRTIQREIEDQLSEKILFDEIGPGQIVMVDVDNWDGEGPRRGRGVHLHRTPEAGQAGRGAGSGTGRSGGHAECGHGHRVINGHYAKAPESKRFGGFCYARARSPDDCLG